MNKLLPVWPSIQKAHSLLFVSKHIFTLVVIASIHIALIEVASVVVSLVICPKVSGTIVVQACTCSIL